MKNIVICCDGTNNQLETDPTNVMRLFAALKRDPQRQVAYYDPGVGTLAQPGVRGAVAKRLSLVYGLAFGMGFTRNLEEAYRFLMWNYEPGDRILLFGFSRGAFTVRALAGMVHMFGLLDREQENLLPYVSRAYKAANFHIANRFQKLAQRRPQINFLGLWDTVSSLGFVYRRLALPFTANNESVHVVRQALAIDERRAYFRQNRWGNQFAATQDIKQVWFAGVHSDVGGGYPEEESDLAKITLQWMIDEARRPGEHTGLLVDDEKLLKLLVGEAEIRKAQREQREPRFQPNAAAKAHESLVSPWWVLEFLPMNYTLKRRDFFWPLGRRRTIESNAVVHQSVLDRMATYGDSYRPPNLGSLGTPEPWSQEAGTPVAAPPDGPSTRLKCIMSASAWVLGAAYFGMVFVFLVTVVVKYLSGHSLAGRWGSPLLDAVFWPRIVAAWLDQPNHAWGALLLAVPLAVLAAGAWLLNRLSGLPQFVTRVQGKILHQRWTGYNQDLAQEQFDALMADGRTAYARMLKMDLAFPLCYGFALHWSLAYARYLAGDVVPHVISLLPLIPMIADWIENCLLLRQLARCPDRLQTGAIRAASAATMVKLATFTATLFMLAGLVAWAWRA